MFALARDRNALTSNFKNFKILDFAKRKVDNSPERACVVMANSSRVSTSKRLAISVNRPARQRGKLGDRFGVFGGEADGFHRGPFVLTSSTSLRFAFGTDPEFQGQELLGVDPSIRLG